MSCPWGGLFRGTGNSDNGYEGVRYNNIIATYLHGPLLPKNPQIADFLIDTALKRRNLEILSEKKPGVKIPPSV